MDVLMPVNALPASSLAVPVPGWHPRALGPTISRPESPASPMSMHTPESWQSADTSTVTSSCSTPAAMTSAACRDERSHGASLIHALEAVASTSASMQAPFIVPPRSSSMDAEPVAAQPYFKPLPALPGHEQDDDFEKPTRSSSACRSSTSGTSGGIYNLPQQSRSAPHLASPTRETPPPVPSMAAAAEFVRSEKRYRALLELVTTEHAYLEELKILRDIYYPLLAVAPFASPDVCQRIARNTDELLLLHERLNEVIDLVERTLQWQVGDGDVSQRSDTRVLHAVEAVCRAYCDEAANFATYAEFCAQHPDATALIAECADSRIEYEAYERQCAAQLSARGIPGPKLRLLDYAIMPVQRICRYPITLAYLLKCTDEDTPAHAAVKEALEAMRLAATDVDNARVARDAERKTIVVARRMEMPVSAHTAFLSFLGQIELVGALQFLHLTPSHPAETAQPMLKVKYLGALLYPTHIVLVKIKKADCYEPRHWFPLRAVTVERLSEADGLLGQSFRLVCGEHRFELGCKTNAERDLWVEHIERSREGSVAAWLGRIAENPVELPFDETTVSSVPVDIVLAPPASPVDATTPTAAPPSSVFFAGRSKLSQILGKTSSAMRDTVDLRLADVYSDACLAARYKPASEVKPLVPNRTRSTTPLGSLGRRKSFAMLDRESRSSIDQVRPTQAGHTRRLSLSTLPLKAFSSSPSPEPTSASPDGEVPVGRRPTMTATRPWSGTWRRGRQRTESYKSTAESGESTDDSPIDLATSSASLNSLTAVAPAGPVVALVNRNGSTSSSSGSSAPPSPSLPTPTDLEGGHGWFNLNPLSRRSRSAVSLPPFASPEELDQAAAAADFLRSGMPDKKRWKDGARTPSGTMGRHRDSSLSLLGLFKPTLSPTLPSPAPVAAPPVTSPVVEEPEPIFSVEFTPRPRSSSIRQQSLPLPTLIAPPPSAPSYFHDGGDSTPRPGMGHRRRSIKVFRRLTHMTPLPSSS